MSRDQSWLPTSDIAVGRRRRRSRRRRFYKSGLPVLFFISLVSVLIHSVSTGQRHNGNDILGNYVVANGKETSILKFPSSVFVHVSIGTCCGTLISERFILTATHCTLNSKSLKVFVGDGMKFFGTQYKIGAIIRHPDYGGTITGRRNDVAMLYTTKPVEISETVKIAELIEPEDLISLSRPCYIAGWGRLSREKKILTNTLHEGLMEITDPRNCQSENNSFSKDADICMKRFKPLLQTTANGDSGAGMFCYSDTRDKYVLTGINSGGIGLNLTVFSKISFYQRWINSVYAMEERGLFSNS